MRIIENQSTDPYFNMAAEEYLLAHAEQDVFMLWRNSDTVVIGKNQNTWAEVDVSYAEANGIAVVRRLSGGGAVFHDLGNVNFTYITAPREDRSIDFSPYTEPIIRALAELGVTAAADGRNDLVVDGAKISGNAQCVFRRPDGSERLLHHGTILFSADMSRLAGVLIPHPEKVQSKGIASVRSRVVNLRDLPGFPAMTAEAFMEHLLSFAARRQDAVISPLTAGETEAIRVLRAEKYTDWAWNFGRSLRHSVQHEKKFSFGIVNAAIEADGGAVTSLSLTGDYFGSAPTAELESALIGTPLREDALRAALTRLPYPVGAYIFGAEAEDLVALLLGRTDAEPSTT